MKWFIEVRQRFDASPMPKDAMDVYWANIRRMRVFREVLQRNYMLPLKTLIGYINWNTSNSRYTSNDDYPRFYQMLAEYEKSLYGISED
jgi:hypothetical protein